MPILFPLSDRQLWQLARALVPEKFAKGQTVFRQGDSADKFYICQKGAFSCFTSEWSQGLGLRVYFVVVAKRARVNPTHNWTMATNSNKALNTVSHCGASPRLIQELPWRHHKINNKSTSITVSRVHELNWLLPAHDCKSPTAVPCSQCLALAGWWMIVDHHLQLIQTWQSMQPP